MKLERSVTTSVACYTRLYGGDSGGSWWWTSLVLVAVNPDTRDPEVHDLLRRATRVVYSVRVHVVRTLYIYIYIYICFIEYI